MTNAVHKQCVNSGTIIINICIISRWQSIGRGAAREGETSFGPVTRQVFDNHEEGWSRIWIHSESNKSLLWGFSVLHTSPSRCGQLEDIANIVIYSVLWMVWMVSLNSPAANFIIVNNYYYY